MIKQACRIGFLMSLVVGGILAGCSDNPVIPPPPNNPITLEIKNGTWCITETVWYTGHDSCVARGSESLDTTDVICNITYGAGQTPFSVECVLADSVGGVPDSVEFSCSISADLGICVLFLEVDGAGRVDSTSFDLNTTLVERLEAKQGQDPAECDRFFGFAVDACTTNVAAAGVWISADGDSLCPEDGKGIPFQTLLTGIATGASRP